MNPAIGVVEASVPTLAGLLATLAVFGLVHQPALADRRVALVIGNGGYAHAPHLPNPPHDAEDVAAEWRDPQ
jgi:hypothetical protein